MWKVLKVVVAVAILIAIVMIAGSLQTFHWVQGRVRDDLGDYTGADPTVSWLLAAGVFCLVYLIPWRSLVFSSVTGRAKTLVPLAAAFIASAGTLKFAKSELLRFTPQGDPAISFIETAEGPVISDLPPGGIDRRTGLRRQPLTVDMLRAIEMEKNRKDKGQPDTNIYFNARDGRNKVWFPVDSCEARDTPGYDDRGRKLVPATAEKVDKCEKERAETERLRKEKADRQARRAEQAARRKEFRETGRYIAEGRFTMIDGVKIVLEETVVLKDQTRVKFRIANIRDELKTYSESKFEFGLVNGEGQQTRSSVVRRVQGAVAIAGDGSLVLPVPGERGWIVVEFARNCEDGGGFALMINNTIAFSKPGEHTVRFIRF